MFVRQVGDLLLPCFSALLRKRAAVRRSKNNPPELGFKSHSHGAFQDGGLSAISFLFPSVF